MIEMRIESNILPTCYKSICLVLIYKFYALSTNTHIYKIYIHIYIFEKPIIYFLLPVGNDSAKNSKSLTETERFVCMYVSLRKIFKTKNKKKRR